MGETAASLLAPWSNFYILAGTSAATLTGLMFVVITLVSSGSRERSTDGISTFSTPTVLHFCAVLLVAATLITPWPTLIAPAVGIALGGAYGVVHVLQALVIARRMSTYRLDLEDLISYTIMPVCAYGAIVVGAAALPTLPHAALYALAAGVVLLILIGIRNAWDIVTFIVVGSMNEPTN